MKLSILGSGSLPVDSDVFTFTNTFINSLILKKQISTALYNTNVKMLMGHQLIYILYIYYLFLYPELLMFIFLIVVKFWVLGKKIGNYFKKIKIKLELVKRYFYLVYTVSSYRRLQSRRLLEWINQGLVNITYLDPAIYTQLAFYWESKSLTGKQKFQKLNGWNIPFNGNGSAKRNW